MINQFINQSPNFVYVKQKLYFYDHQHLNNGNNGLRAVVTESLRNTILFHYHNHSLGSAHLGIHKMESKITLKYFWSHMHTDIINYCQACHKCKTNKHDRVHYHHDLKSLPVPHRPFELVGVDIKGQLTSTLSGNKYIIIFIDHFSRFVIAVPLSDVTSNTILTALVDHLVCQHGAPEVLLSDNASYFTSQLSNSVYNLLGIKKIFFSPYHPQTNGAVERFNGTLASMLRSYVDNSHNDWDLHLQQLVFSYNISCQSSLGVSPFKFLYARNPHLPIDNILNILLLLTS